MAVGVVELGNVRVVQMVVLTIEVLDHAGILFITTENIEIVVADVELVFCKVLVVHREHPAVLHVS